jgi:hypothetical protein
MAVEHDFLTHLFSLEAPYPWEGHSSEGEAYLATVDELAQEMLQDDAIADSLSQGWDAFSGQLEAQWPRATPGPALLILLQQQFQERMPTHLLQTIATTASQVANSGRPLVDQLVDCVNTALPGWDTGDLAVLARPLAYSLRDGRSDILAVHLRSVSPVAWEALSDVEQVRLSLAIASVALKASESKP